MKDKENKRDNIKKIFTEAYIKRRRSEHNSRSKVDINQYRKGEEFLFTFAEKAF